MTERESIKTRLAKIKAEYPNVVSENEILNLAIRLDKRKNLITSISLILCTIGCFIAFLILNTDIFPESRGLILFVGVACYVEFFITLGHYRYIEQRYRPALEVKYEGKLTKDKILKDGKKVLSKESSSFRILKRSLDDKKEEQLDSVIFFFLRKYYFCFNDSDTNTDITYSVKSKAYFSATLDTEYYVVITPENKIASVYKASNWVIDEELTPHICGFTPKENDANYDFSQDTGKKTKKILPITAIILSVLGYLSPVLIAVILETLAFVLSIVGWLKQSSKLSVTALILNAILFFFFIVTLIFYI